MLRAARPGSAPLARPLRVARWCSPRPRLLYSTDGAPSGPSAAQLPTLTSKYGKKVEVKNIHGLHLYEDFLSPAEAERFVSGLLRSGLRSEEVDESMGRFRRYREPTNELLEVLEKIDESGVLEGVDQSDGITGTFWLDEFDEQGFTEPTIELPGTGDRSLLLNFFSPHVLSFHYEMSESAAPELVLVNPGSLMVLTGPSRQAWWRQVQKGSGWEYRGRRIPKRRRFELKLIPAFDRAYMEKLVAGAEADLASAPTGAGAGSG